MFGLSVVVFAIGASAAEISGVVTGPKGPEAGVWVIAETTDLPTKFSKVVVTDERGRDLEQDRHRFALLHRQEEFELHAAERLGLAMRRLYDDPS